VLLIKQSVQISFLKRKARQEPIKDNECSFGPPDKKQHFGTMQEKKSRKSKGKSKADDSKEIALEECKEVEVL